jgi:hypothetical protein
MSSASTVTEAQARKKIGGVFFVGYVVVCLLFLLMSLAGTTADPLGVDPTLGKYDWSAHGRALPPAEAGKIPNVFYPAGVNDPLGWDALPGGSPPERLIPPESESAGPKKLTEDDKRKLAAKQAAEARAKEVADKIQKIFKVGDKQLRQNRYPQAKETYLQAAKLNPGVKPEIAEKFYAKGKDQERKRSWSRAKLLYRMSLHFDYENAKYHDALAATSDALGDKKKAAEHRRLAAKFR